MPEDLPTPTKSLKEIEKEQKRLKTEESLIKTNRRR